MIGPGNKEKIFDFENLEGNSANLYISALACCSVRYLFYDFTLSSRHFQTAPLSSFYPA
jgi:hypothetical protein